MTFDAERAVRLADETLSIEAAAVLDLKRRLTSEFARAVQLMLQVRGRVVVMGMGKSGHVGRKIAATLSSTGTPAMFVHPAEASHGDLGMITATDVVLAISNSGEVDELTVILPVVKRLGAPLVAMTGRRDSSLGRHADVVVDCGVEKEACPLNLAPTASTTAQMALGDALAVRRPQRTDRDHHRRLCRRFFVIRCVPCPWAQQVLARIPRSLQPVFGIDHATNYKGFPEFTPATMLHCNNKGRVY